MGNVCLDFSATLRRDDERLNSKLSIIEVWQVMEIR